MTMFGPTLDVAIGLALIYVLFSLLLSAILESFASVLKLRAKALENGLIAMLANPTVTAAAKPRVAGGIAGIFFAQKRALAAVPVTDDAAGRAFFAAVYGHPLVAGTSSSDRPSYVRPADVALAVIHVLTQNLPEGSLGSRIERGIVALPAELVQLKTGLTTIAEEACGDVAAFRAGVANWFDAAMDRLSGDYKRFGHLCLFIFGLAAAIACNVDGIRIARSLYAEPGVRSALEKQAEAYVAANPTLPTVPPGDLKTQLDRVATAEQVLVASAPPVGWSGAVRFAGAGACAMAVVGWLLTALAGMSGASFWFATLLRLLNLRGTGPKPAPSG